MPCISKWNEAECYYYCNATYYSYNISFFFQLGIIVVALMQCNNKSYPKTSVYIAKSIAQDSKFVIYVPIWMQIYLSVFFCIFLKWIKAAYYTALSNAPNAKPEYLMSDDISIAP